MDITNSKSLPQVRFRDGKIDNIDEVFDGVPFGVTDRAGNRGRSCLAWINEEDAIVTGLDDHRILWGEVEIGHTWSHWPFTSGHNSYYRIHATNNSVQRTTSHNAAAATVNCANP